MKNKKSKRLLPLITVAVMTTVVAVNNVLPFKPSIGTVETEAATADHWTDDWLHVCGNKIHDKNCKEVWLTGVNWFGFNCTENILHGWWASVEADEMVAGIADKGFNLIRVPVSTELLVSWMNGTPLKAAGVTAYDDTMGGGVNIEIVQRGIKENSMGLFDYFAELCKKHGLKIMIDVHSAESDNSGHDKNLWYHGKFTTKDWQDSLVWLADKYKNDDTIIAYDLKNEPHGKAQEAKAGTGAKWDGSTDLNNWKHAAQTCGEAILKVNPNALIMVEGVEVTPVAGHTYAEDPIGYPVITNYYGGWWGGNLREVKNHPITLKNPSTGFSQLVYSPHEYGPSVYAQSWFNKDFTLQTLHDDYMHETWDYLLPDYPLLIGEWGGHMDKSINEKWMTIMRDYMIDNKVHHTFWCYNPNSGDTGGLIGNDWKTWDMNKYGLVEKSLWKIGTKYVGLDHQIPLGKNGMTLTEAFGGTPPNPPDYTVPTPTTPTPTTPVPVPSSTDPLPIPTDSVVPTTATPSATPTVSNSSAVPTTTPAPTSVIPTPTSDKVEPTLKGDVDNSGKVDIGDVILLSKFLVNTATLTPVQKANANVEAPETDAIDVNDCFKIVQYIANIITSL
jgi:aryl-phospho-beta-D-glucosidase BglC (GH1 family)